MNESKTPNYTEAQQLRLKEVYAAEPCRESVEALAKEMGKSPRSIISKLSNMGVYIAPPRLTKAGTPIVKKEALVAEIMERLAVDAPSLVKANKQDLERLVEATRELTGEANG